VSDTIEIRTWHARRDKNFTVVELAELTGLGKSTINNIENGKTSPTLNQLELIAKATGWKMSELFNSQYK